MRPKLIEHPGPLERFDERDTIFARACLIDGTDNYQQYYTQNPDKKLTDDRFRALGGLASPGTQRYRAGEASLVEGLFEASELVANAVEREDRGEVTGEGIAGTMTKKAPIGEIRHVLPDASPRALSRFVKEAALFLGADDVGICDLDPAFVYTYRGRRADRFGVPITLDHRHAIVLVFVMRPEFVRTGPEMLSIAETARSYQQGAVVSFALANALKRMGYQARAHVDANYLVVCPPLAEMAGLGEVGRNGFLIHRTHGPGVRLGVVTIDAHLENDERTCYGIADFCRVCAKCARNCPAGAIPEGELTVDHGALKWPMKKERCYHYWRTQGTDCGVCVRTCTFAKLDTPLHQWVRKIVAGTTIFNRMFLWADDLFYGANPDPAQPPLLGIGKQQTAPHHREKKD